MTEIEMNGIGENFSYDETQKAYKMLGIYKRVEDYPPVPEPDDDDDGDYDAYFNDFDKWWKGLSYKDKVYVYDEVVGKEIKRAGAIRQIVAGQLVAMIENDVLNDYGVESFVGWCEDGDVFANMGLNEQGVEECMALVRKIAPIVDDLVMNHLNPRPEYV